MLVTAAIIEQDGRVFIAKRRPGKHMGGKWEFPGGKIEPGESPEESLARELREELAVEAQVGEFLCRCSYAGDGVSLELLVYRASISAGTPQLLEHQEMRWVLPEELLSYDLADSDRKVVENLFLRR
ncbi:MAG: (deoxy)nucleoside triphosphate pyrophosphohydrolase [Spirochaetia bacterium]